MGDSLAHEGLSPASHFCYSTGCHSLIGFPLFFSADRTATGDTLERSLTGLPRTAQCFDPPFHPHLVSVDADRYPGRPESPYSIGLSLVLPVVEHFSDPDHPPGAA